MELDSLFQADNTFAFVRKVFAQRNFKQSQQTH